MPSQSKPTGAVIDTSLPPPKTTSPAVKAAQLFNKFTALAEQETEELANAPQSIARRYEEKRAKLREGVAADVLELLDRMRGEP